MDPKWKPPVQSPESVTVMVSSPDDGMFPTTTTFESLRSGDDEALQALQKALADGAGENVTTIWSPFWGRPARPPPLVISKDDAIGVTAMEGLEGELVPTEFVAVTVK